MTMRALRYGLGMLLVTSASAAWACADSSCYPSWKLFGGDRKCEDRGYLAPGNDTRVNLTFLVADNNRTHLGDRYAKHSYGSAGYGNVFLDPYVQQASLYGGGNPKADSDTPVVAREVSAFSGTRCASIERGGREFAAALAANKGLRAGEAAMLTSFRTSLVKVCENPTTILAAPNTAGLSPAAQAFAGYVEASIDFYGNNFNAARTGFTTLAANAADPWVRETASYMLIRTEYAAAQASTEDQYGDYDGKKVDRPTVKRGLEANAAYLKAWPNGRYAASAQGLVRRGLWLAGDYEGLALLYERLVDTDLGQGGEGIAAEIDNKWLFNPDAKDVTAKGATMLAVQDLYAMRTDLDEGGDVWRAPTLTAAQLEAQKAAFAGRPELWSFLQATHALTVAKDPRRVLSLIPDDARQAGYTNLAFSRQVLRGLALAALKDRNEEGFWLDLLGGARKLWQRPSVELGLAIHWERNGKLARVFAKDSPIQESMIRRELIIHSASPDMLRTAAADTARGAYERDLAAFVLLYKDLSRGNYAAFAQDRRLVRADAASEGYLYYLPDQEAIPAGVFARGKWSDGYACPSVDQTARTLAANPQAVSARLCLGDFFRLNGFDGISGPDQLNKPDELGGVASLFPGTPTPRSAIYTSIIANPAVKGPDKAYALYRAVMCYAPAGSNGCGGTAVPKSQRKAWYDQLKRDYPSSPWAKKLRYYW